MYVAHFGLREPPFSIAPDPAYLFLSARHQEALGHLLYGTAQYGGFVQLTGEVGTGKTTIVRALLREKLGDVDVAMIHNPRQDEFEFVASICDELGVAYPRHPPPTLKTLIDALNAHLLDRHAKGRRTVVIIDEAQNLDPGVLEQVRLLTNLETDKDKLLRIMLVGQPELADLLARPELRQLASRITARYHLLPLSAEETRQYIAHRLRVAGGNPELFTPAALRLIHRRARGVPRQVNVICDRALLGAYARGEHRVSAAVARRAAIEALGDTRSVAARWLSSGALPWLEGAVALVALTVAAILLFRVLHGPVERAPVRKIAAATAKAVQPASPLAPSSSAAGKPVTATADIGRILDAPEPLGQLLQRLIALWSPQITIPAGDDVCSALAQHQLACFRGQGSWSDLEQMDLPAILTLSLGRGAQQYVLLRRLDDDNAVLDTADGPLKIALTQLGPLWGGEFLLLWENPAGSQLIGPASKGPQVQWLRRALARAAGQTPPANPQPSYGPELRKALLDFQRTHNLDADGLAGVRTLIALVRAQPDFSGPSLSPAP